MAASSACRDCALQRGPSDAAALSALLHRARWRVKNSLKQYHRSKGLRTKGIADCSVACAVDVKRRGF